MAAVDTIHPPPVAEPLTDEERRAMIDRIVFLAVGATDEGLRQIVAAADKAPQRPLDSETLAKAQRAREGTILV